jgi:hypothetical protein
MMTDQAIILTDTVERLEEFAAQLWKRGGLLPPEDPDADAEGDKTIPVEVRIKMRRRAETIDLAIEAWRNEAQRLEAMAKEEFVV